MKRLEDKVAIITGAASGIGRSMARSFAAEGAKLILADVEVERLAKVAAELEERGAAFRQMVVDVQDREQVEAMVEAAISDFGGVDVLCNNAGILDNLTPLHEADDELWDRVMNINVKGPFMASRKVLKVMMEAGRGSIIHTASAAGDHGGRGGAVYTASKHAVMGLTKSIAWYYGSHGIRSNAICPGSVQTRMASSIVPHPDGFAKYQPYFPQIPRHGKAAEVAEVALFLASDESSFVNGACIPVDGGWTSY